MSYQNPRRGGWHHGEPEKLWMSEDSKVLDIPVEELSPRARWLYEEALEMMRREELPERAMGDSRMTASLRGQTK